VDQIIVGLSRFFPPPPSVFFPCRRGINGVRDPPLGDCGEVVFTWTGTMLVWGGEFTPQLFFSSRQSPRRRGSGFAGSYLHALFLSSHTQPYPPPSLRSTGFSFSGASRTVNMEVLTPHLCPAVTLSYLDLCRAGSRTTSLEQSSSPWCISPFPFFFFFFCSDFPR